MSTFNQLCVLDNMISSRTSFIKPSKSYYMILTKEILANNPSPSDINEGLCLMCFRGYDDIVNLLIENGANEYQEGFLQACRGDHVSTVEIILSEINDDYDTISDGFYLACADGSIKVVEYLYPLKNELLKDRMNDFIEVANQNGHITIEAYLNTRT